MGSQSHHSFVYLEGSLVKEPEIIHFSNGSLAKFTLRRNFLVPSYNKDEKGTWKDEFFDVKKNLKTGETLKLKKWSKVVVSGELCQECWEDNETKKKRSRVIIKAKTITVSADEPDNVHDQNVQNLTQTFAPQQQYQQGPPQQQQQPMGNLMSYLQQLGAL